MRLFLVEVVATGGAEALAAFVFVLFLLLLFPPAVSIFLAPPLALHVVPFLLASAFVLVLFLEDADDEEVADVPALSDFLLPELALALPPPPPKKEKSDVCCLLPVPLLLLMLQREEVSLPVI